MKNRLFAATCCALFFNLSAASALNCREAFQDIKKSGGHIAYRAVDYFSLPQRLRRSVQFHQRSLIKFAENGYKALEKGQYHFDTLLRAPENPKLTTEQQRELRMEIAGFLLTNYEKLYIRHEISFKQWINTNANSALRDAVLAIAKDRNRSLDKSTDIYVLTDLNKILLDLSAKEGIGFSPETIAYFDALPLEEKFDLVGPSGEPPTWIPNIPTVSHWARAVRLHVGRKKIQEKLNEYKLSKDISPLSQYVSNELGLGSSLGYYNQDVLLLLMEFERLDKTSYQNPLAQQIYILVRHRLYPSLSVSDVGRERRNVRLKDPSAIAILSILGELSREPSILSEVGWAEIRTLINKNFNPQIRSYLSSSLPTITTYFELLSSSAGFPDPTDIFADSDHNIESFHKKFGNGGWQTISAL